MSLLRGFSLNTLYTGQVSLVQFHITGNVSMSNTKTAIVQKELHLSTTKITSKDIYTSFNPLNFKKPTFKPIF